MQFTHHCILAFLLAIISNVFAAENTTCHLTIKDAEFRPSDTHIRIRGAIEIGNDDCKPTTNKTDDVTSHVSFIALSNTTFNFTDSANVTHAGNACNITASWYNKPDTFDSTNSTEVFVPLRFINVISCNNDTLPATTTTTTTTKSARRTRTRKTRRTRSRTTTTRTTTTTTRRTRRRTTRRTTTKKVSSSSSSDFDYSKHFDGIATFFTPNQGACGDWNDDGDLIAAIGGSLYGSYSSESSYCGKKVKVINKDNKKSVTVTIKDACESCPREHIDLSPGAFGKIGDYDTGILDVDWYILD